MTLRAAPRPARRGRRSCPAPWTGRAFPLADSEFAEFLEDQRHRQRHRHLAGGARAPVQAVQSDRQRPGAKIRGHGTRPGDGEAPRRAARRCGGGGERGRRGLALHGLAAAPRRGARRRSHRRRRRPLPAPRPLPGARTALVVEDDYKSADLIRVQLEAEGFTVLHAASAEAALGARGAAAAVADHARHHAARHGRLGVPRPHQADARAVAHPGRDHFDRRGSQQGLRARRRGGHAKADLAAGAVRLARRSRTVSASRRARRSKSSWSTTIPRRWS